MKFHSFATYLPAFTFEDSSGCTFPLKGWCVDREGDDEGGREKTCSHSLLCEQNCSAGQPILLLLLLLPLPCRGLLCRGLLIYRTLVCEWQKFLGISICLLITFQIMCCSLLWLAQKQFCYSYVGLPWIFFPLLVHWKHHGRGGKQMRKCFCVYTTSKVYFKKLRKGIQNIPGLGGKGERKWD